MNDRELLELAAKAAGLNVGTGEGAYDDLKWWNPLQNDGDALRLAVQLGIGVLPACDGVRGRTAVCANCFGWHVFDTLEKPLTALESTRRAIVRAAAEIGKGMK